MSVDSVGLANFTIHRTRASCEKTSITKYVTGIVHVYYTRQPRFNSYRRILMAVRFIVVAVTRRSRSTKLLYFEPA